MEIKNNHSIELDLTSFIDVIFVILIAFIVAYSNNKTSLPTPAPIIEPMEDVVSIGLIVEYSDEDIKTRNVQLTCYPETNFETVPPIEGDNDDSFTVLQEQITQIVNDNPDVPVLLSIYEDKILYRDHKRIEQMIEQLDVNSNFYSTWKRTEENASESVDQDKLENSDGQ